MNCLSCGKEVTGDGKWCPRCADTLEKIKSAQQGRRPSSPKAVVGCAVIAVLLIGLGYLVFRAVGDHKPNPIPTSGESSPQPTSGGPAPAPDSLSRFEADLKSGFRDDTLESLAVKDDRVMIRLANSPIKNFSGLIAMVCANPSTRELKLRELSVVDFTGTGWTYSISPESCESIIEQVMNQRGIEGRNSFELFVEKNRKRTTSRDAVPK